MAPSGTGGGVGGGNGARAPGEYEDFLTDLQSVIAERVEELRARRSVATPAVFLDEDKVVREWPDLAGRIIEELR